MAEGWSVLVRSHLNANQVQNLPRLPVKYPNLAAPARSGARSEATRKEVASEARERNVRT